jgi:hypothetical protein
MRMRVRMIGTLSNPEEIRLIVTASMNGIGVG